MRQVYIKHLAKKYAAAADKYLSDDQVPPGKILDIHRVSAWFDNLATTEAVRWYVKIAHEHLWLGDDKPATDGGPAQRDLEMHIGEGMSIGVYSADITTDEVFHLVVTGCLYELDPWRKIVPADF